MNPKRKSALSDAIQKRIESAGKPAHNLSYTTMQLIMAEAERRSDRRNKIMNHLAALIWIIMGGLGIFTIVKTCGSSLSQGFGAIIQTLSDPNAWDSPLTLTTISLGILGLLIMLANYTLGPLYDRLMIRELMKLKNHN